ncbi:hypothetical protein E4U42_006372, partial [Claviceps africana]
CIPLLREARARGVPITAETCFHYLGLSAEDIPAGDTRHKCCPPIRDARNRDALWDELLAPDSCIRTVVSDHSPCTPELKLLPPRLDPSPPPEPDPAAGNFLSAWGGISSLGLGLPIMHSSARRPPITHMVRLCCQTPAEQIGLSHRKGALAPDMDADICVFDDTARWTLSRADMRWRNACSPWEGHVLSGRVRETWLRGRKIFDLGAPDGGFDALGPTGEAITETRTA